MKKLRGFTLIELMMSVAILAFVVAGISQVLIAQSQASNVQSLQRDLEESGRLAMLEIARAVRLAGYGMAPVAAFDFGRYGCSTPDNQATCYCTTANAKTTACSSGAFLRDRTDGPDELVVNYREPMFSRVITSVTTGGTAPVITLNAPLKTAPRPGTIMELISPSVGKAAYFKVASSTTNTITFLALTTADGYYPVPLPGPLLASVDASFVGGAALQINRVRYFISNDTDGVPSLWKERGNGNELLFRGIEDMQLSYDIGQGPPPPFGIAPTTGPATTCTPGNPNGWSYGLCPTASVPLIGATLGSVTTLGIPPATPTVTMDWINDNYDSAGRYSGLAANIRNVTISIVARATRASPDKTGDSVPAIGNRPARAADTFRRMVLQMNEQPINLTARSEFMPMALVAPDGNIGGG
jgi:type IV pilus assembly protein PilW